jgi:seryl-tRNA synthetase
MLDIKWIRENPDALDKALGDRGAEAAAARLIALDEARRQHIAETQDAQQRRNDASKEIGKAKASGDEAAATALIDEVAKLKAMLQEAEAKEKRLDGELRNELAAIPNVPADDVPVGPDESANVEFRRFGERKQISGFTAKEHFELGEALGDMDFETAAKLSGSRFVVLKGQLARLERALGQFMLDLQTRENGYTEVQPPLLVRDDALFGTSQLPKFADDQFATAGHDGGDRMWLIPTAEVPLTNLVRESIVAEADLPLRFAALTPCFRSEAGAAGQDTRGMMRQHQFDKVELVAIATPDQAVAEHERMLASAEEVLKRLDLHYRVMTLSTGDMGFAAEKTWDIEVWLPGQGRYREISSVSRCGDFQARRMEARYRDQGGKVRHVHTLNGSGVAVGRALIAVMETYQNADGSVTIPWALAPYMGGIEKIGP